MSNANMISGSYDPYLVFLSIAIAIIAAYTALDFSGQINSTQGCRRLAWLIGGAIAMGTGIWSMHFMGMLAFHLSIPISYTLPGLLLSILAAILTSIIAFYTVSRGQLDNIQLCAGSLLMGSGIIAMHYTGMATMKLPAVIYYNWYLVGLSVITAILVSGIAIWLTFNIQNSKIIANRWQKIIGAFIMGLAIPITHYIGMFAVSFYAEETSSNIAAINSSTLATITSTLSFAFLGVALLISSETKIAEKTLALVNLETEIQERQKTEHQLKELTNHLQLVILSLNSEIQERKQTEAALQQSEALLKSQKLELESTLKELQNTQLQLIQSEKMSSLGQLVAGVAHEINNPVSFIYSNIDHAKEYIQNLIQLINIYQEKYDSSPEIIEQSEAIELDFIMEDLPKLINSMKIGSERIKNIVLSLRNFSRMDEADFKEVNIHDGIDNTLVILQHRLKAQHHRPEITVIKQYVNVPQINCYPGQLNQVFMNILANAIDALEDSKNLERWENNKEQPTIWICTKMSSSVKVTVTIRDNALGIPEEAKKRLFDQFFTTKPIGKGTGMGLAISYQIITKKHGGNLYCNSLDGQGAEFVIEIPVQP